MLIYVLSGYTDTGEEVLRGTRNKNDIIPMISRTIDNEKFKAILIKEIEEIENLDIPTTHILSDFTALHILELEE